MRDNIEDKRYENLLIRLSQKYFGSEDYRAHLEVLAPSSTPVRMFKKELEQQLIERK